MKRRTNKSHKVANVKLRPAAEPVRPSSSFIIQDSQPASSSGSLGTCPRPFLGVVLCATGIDKTPIFKMALELGATCFSAFTDKVTHLVATDTTSLKYKCAVERRIPVMRPEWIVESYNEWLRGDDVELHETVAKYRLPIFSGVVLCPTGITPLSRRTLIQKQLKEHGGTYSSALTRPVTVTHLLCSGDEETDKIKYATKFNGSGEAEIFIVWEDWFWDSLKFQGRFDEQAYLVSAGSRPEPRELPIPETLVSPTTSMMLDTPSALYPGKEKEPEEEQASFARPPQVAVKLWNSLLKPRGLQIQADGTVLRSPTKPKPTTPPPPLDPPDEVHKAKSILASAAFRRANSFVIPPPETTVWPRRRPAQLGEQEPVPGPSKLLPRGFLANKSFLLLGEADKSPVRDAIEDSGGAVVDDEDDDESQIDFVVVRLQSGSSIYQQHASNPRFHGRWRTECWLEKCLHMERICDPSESITFKPLSVKLPIPGAHDVRISFSGLDESEKCFIGRLIKALGMTHVPAFTRFKTTHLFCPSATGAKFEKANEWNIQVVGSSWLENMTRGGTLPSNNGGRSSGEPMAEITNAPPERSQTPIHPPFSFGRPDEQMLSSSHQMVPSSQSPEPELVMRTPKRGLVARHTEPEIMGTDSPPPSPSPQRSRSTPCLNPDSSPDAEPPASPRKAPPPNVPQDVTRALHSGIQGLFPGMPPLNLGKRRSSETTDEEDEEDRDAKRRLTTTKNQRSRRKQGGDADELALGSDSVNERESLGLGIRYEDPEQAGERNRLMKMLDKGVVQDRRPKRRSSNRIPGF